jgi:enterochelin esterase-like enzyme
MIISSAVTAQPYLNYSNDSLIFDSGLLGESIRVNIHLPETFRFSSDHTRYPVILIFDSQHTRSYPHIIRSMDLLTSETQIPESIIVGVPFNFQNRLYFTSGQKKEQDTISGIEKMEQFIFSELLPLLKKNYKASDYLSITGHSRTAFLVNYLAWKHPENVNNVLSLSGFLNESLLSLDTFVAFLTHKNHFPGKFRYYYTAGTTLEELNYLTEYRQLKERLALCDMPDQVFTHYREEPYANHMTNYWISVPYIFTDIFSEYNSVLDRWFFEKLDRKQTGNPLEEFRKDLEEAGKKTGHSLNPGLTHIFSLANHFAYSRQDYTTAEQFMLLGLEYFSDYPDFYVELAEYSRLMNDHDKAARYVQIMKEKVTRNPLLSDAEKRAYLENLNE